jgi:Zn-dependent protease with chaperone function
VNSPAGKDTQESYVMTTFWTPRHCAVPFLLVVALLCAGQAPLPEPVTDQETELGQAVYNQLRDKGEIIASSPLYDSLRPIAEAISRVAQPRYNHPFKFFLVHETHPNAFATPGGNVYVVDSLLYFVKNTEQLAVRSATRSRIPFTAMPWTA